MNQLKDAPMINRDTALSFVFIGLALLVLVLLFAFIPYFQLATSTVIDLNGRNWEDSARARVYAASFALLMSCVFSAAGAAYGSGYERWLGVTVLVLGIISLAVFWVAVSVISH
jgi:hypothetical protein